ncbi:hypothetical protein VP01_160g10 [Puccinia sorghi]|uniref:Small ribosomal subunit protein mS35 mitochondrial conserved domain-containing protein n=1 Tax=Puccinia sorghi TaxID=27349 RepID=A0A0L6VHQ9_9BASI|nr:hypothetical protein VP01_160g10 [Puccinia sorghi]
MIKVSNKGKFKDHPLGGPGMEEVFDMERDLAKPFAMQDVPAVTHLHWAQARNRLNKLRTISFQMPLLTKYQQPFVPPPPEAHVIVRTQDDMGFHRGKQDSQRGNKKASIRVNISQIPALRESGEAMHKFKLLSGGRWYATEGRSEWDMSSHDGDPEGMVKISCDDYGSLWMNQKWCSDTLDRLIAEASDPSRDPMSDIPLDLRPTLKRLHRKKHRPWATNPAHQSPKFPTEWLPDTIQHGLQQAQQTKLSIMKEQKLARDRLDAQIRALLHWDGMGIPPTNLFANLSTKTKEELNLLLAKRAQIRDLSSHLDRHFLPTFLATTLPTPTSNAHSHPKTNPAALPSSSSTSTTTSL